MEIRVASINLSMPIYSVIIINIDCIKDERGIINDSYSRGSRARTCFGTTRPLARCGTESTESGGIDVSSVTRPTPASRKLSNRRILEMTKRAFSHFRLE